MTYRYSSKDQAATIEVHTGSPKGPVVSTLDFTATGGWDTFEERTVPLQNPGGQHDLYFVFVKKEAPFNHLASLDWIQFVN